MLFALVTLLPVSSAQSDLLKVDKLWEPFIYLKEISVYSKLFKHDYLQPETIERRRLTRFKAGHEDNNLCWERHGVDGFISPIDAHNHFRPFYGPPVPWNTYMDWMKNHGILFTTMLGECKL